MQILELYLLQSIHALCQFKLLGLHQLLQFNILVLPLSGIQYQGIVQSLRLQLLYPPPLTSIPRPPNNLRLRTICQLPLDTPQLIPQQILVFLDIQLIPIDNIR